MSTSRSRDVVDPAAVLVPVDEYEALEETAEILSDEDTLFVVRRGR